eukprot:GFUD01031563.1.p1 GENE.GFUD01031563.1~~GFUD01031563.1.p1  ORF type:complete len:157 (-),score=37.40 GFUD01031563.1:177-611(-)
MKLVLPLAFFVLLALVNAQGAKEKLFQTAQCAGTLCPGGCCPHAGWYCCADNTHCSADAADCPSPCTGTMCPGGCCPHAGWYCCSDNTHCASTAGNCPSVAAWEKLVKMADMKTEEQTMCGSDCPDWAYCCPNGLCVTGPGECD